MHYSHHPWSRTPCSKILSVSCPTATKSFPWVDLFFAISSLRFVVATVDIIAFGSLMNHDSRDDLRWWLQFLRSWSSISMIQLSRISFDVATDASGAKGIGGVYKRIVSSERIPSRHQSKKIDWKEMFAVLHAFLLWHEGWRGGRVRLARDNSSVVDALNKHSIKGAQQLSLFNGYFSLPRFTIFKSSH